MPARVKTPANTHPNYNYNARSNYGYNSGSGANSGSSADSGSTKVKHNRIYTATEIIQKFGNPSSRTSTTTTEHWVYKCKDGVVHVHFTQIGYVASSSTSKSEKLRLEIKSVDSTSSRSANDSRF